MRCCATDRRRHPRAARVSAGPPAAGSRARAPPGRPRAPALAAGLPSAGPRPRAPAPQPPAATVARTPFLVPPAAAPQLPPLSAPAPGSSVALPSTAQLGTLLPSCLGHLLCSCVVHSGTSQAELPAMAAASPAMPKAMAFQCLAAIICSMPRTGLISDLLPDGRGPRGSQQGIDLCARLLLDPADAFVFENPGYLMAGLLPAWCSPTSVLRRLQGLDTAALPRDGARAAYVRALAQFARPACSPSVHRQAIPHARGRGPHSCRAAPPARASSTEVCAGGIARACRSTVGQLISTAANSSTPDGKACELTTGEFRHRPVLVSAPARCCRRTS